MFSVRLILWLFICQDILHGGMITFLTEIFWILTLETLEKIEESQREIYEQIYVALNLLCIFVKYGDDEFILFLDLFCDEQQRSFEKLRNNDDRSSSSVSEHWLSETKVLLSIRIFTNSIISSYCLRTVDFNKKNNSFSSKLTFDEKELSIHCLTGKENRGKARNNIARLS